jgi:hypothetical protein
MSNAYETREQWLNAFVEASRTEFDKAGYPLPAKVRVSVGFTSTGMRGKSIGECWSNECSADGYFEIFLKPTTTSDGRMADILTHELCHAAAGLAAGHGPNFGKVARALGLEGKLTSTVAGSGWYAWALPILSALGPMPYGAIEGGTSTAKPKQKTNLLKVECNVCGFIARVTNKHIAPHTHLNCPVPDCVGLLEVEGE